MEEHQDVRDAARHPIGVVAERTGLSLDVLRVWERRYGVVEPTRDEGGRRLYSDADIERLRLLARATSGGRGISQVARLPVAELRELVLEDDAERWNAARSVSAGSQAEALVARALERTRELDAAGVESALRQAAALLGLLSFLDEVVPAFARRIGDAWHAGELSVAQEHLATGVLRPLLAQLRGELAPEPGAPVVLVATPAGERHEIGALLVAAAAAAEGARVVYLGADMPAEEIAVAARASRALVVALSIVFGPDPAAVSAELLRLRTRLPADTPILVGGAAIAQLAPRFEHLGVIALPDLAELRRWLRSGGLGVRVA
jgi:DNA-binding transcriptional MerR regulator/methylmalonyl-CoA mutase cobalamin-binding subunit